MTQDKIDELRKYRNADGNLISLYQLIKTEPEWAKAQIQSLQADLAEAEKVITRAKDMIQANHYFSGLGELKAYTEKMEKK